jgi:hypothetical protein
MCEKLPRLLARPLNAESRCKVAKGLILPQRGIHTAGCGIAHVGQDVGVGVQGEAYVGVSEELLDELGVHALP